MTLEFYMWYCIPISKFINLDDSLVSIGYEEAKSCFLWGGVKIYAINIV
jgi:hypothetical protein